MPRLKQTLTIEQIEEILNDQASEETIFALKSFLKAELDRRRKAGVRGGRPSSGIDEKELRRERNRRYNAKVKAKKPFGNSSES